VDARLVSSIVCGNDNTTDDATETSGELGVEADVVLWMKAELATLFSMGFDGGVNRSATGIARTMVPPARVTRISFLFEENFPRLCGA